MRSWKPSSADTPTSSAKRPVDTSAGPEAVDIGLNLGEEVVDEEIKLDNEEKGTVSFGNMRNQDIFWTQESSGQSQPSRSGMQDIEEGSSDVPLKRDPSTLTKCLQLRK